MTFSSKHVYSAIRWALLARLSLQLLSWASTIIVMRLLSPGDYGTLAVAAIFTGLAALLSEAGLNEVILRHKAPDQAFQRAVLGAVLLLNSALYLLLFASSGVIANSFAIPQLSTVLPLLALQFMFNALALLPVSLLERKLHYKAMAAVESVAVLSSIVCALALAYLGYGVWALVWSAVLGSAMRYIAANLISRSALLPSFRFNVLKAERSFASAVLLNKLCWYLSSVADDFIIGKLLGKEKLGYYAVSKDLALLFQQKTAAIIHQISFPLLSQSASDSQRNALVFKGAALLSLLVLPLTLVMFSMAPLMVQVLLGERWQAVGPLLALMVLALPVRVLNNVLGNAVAAAGYPQQRLLVQACSLLLIIVLTASGGLSFGLLGAVVGWLMANLLLLPLLLWRYLPCLNIALWPFVSQLLANWQALLVLALLLLIQQLVPWHDTAPLLILAINLLSAVLCYGVASWRFNPDGCYSLRKLLQPSYTGAAKNS
ncbi:MAG: oligosaccharide flippase family protein [Gammaproteobacteria bacterium]|nr:oligosaccharide flippase family protein [Gammaproteobacteria bacterium]